MQIFLAIVFGWVILLILFVLSRLAVAHIRRRDEGRLHHFDESNFSTTRDDSLWR